MDKVSTEPEAEKTFSEKRDYANPKKRRLAFNVEEKYNLINEVKKKRCVWDTADARHSNNVAVAAAWREIATALEKRVDECKSAWSSLRDSRRYHLNITKKKKSGDAGGDVLASPDIGDVGDWEFADALNFLPNLQRKRTTFKSLELQDNDAVESQDSLAHDDPSTSNYRYSQPHTPSRKSSSDQDLAEIIKQYIESQTNEPPAEKPTLKYHAQYAYMDTILKKLPDNVAEDLAFDFICKIKEEAKHYTTFI